MSDVLGTLDSIHAMSLAQPSPPNFLVDYCSLQCKPLHLDLFDNDKNTSTKILNWDPLVHRRQNVYPRMFKKQAITGHSLKNSFDLGKPVSTTVFTGLMNQHKKGL